MPEHAYAICLVDYDNVRLRRDITSADVSFNLTSLAEEIRSVASAHTPRVEEVEVRLYGGWVDERGLYTPLGEWVLSALSDIRSRYGGVRIVPVLVTALAEVPTHKLVGTCRTDVKPKRQKMVDAMLTLDMCHFVAEVRCAIVVLSDDDDLVPGLVTAAHRAGTEAKVYWRHLGRVNPVLNGKALEQLGVAVAALRVPV